jgi:Tetratricopeptide repeat
MPKGKMAEAEQACKRALAGYEKVLGLAHPLARSAANNLAIVYTKQGKIAEAEQISMQKGHRLREADNEDYIFVTPAISRLELNKRT